MSELTRFGISIDNRLLKLFDELLLKKGYVNRSEAIRDLIRKAMVEEHAACDNEVIMGTITLVYDHHTRELSESLTELQHSHHESILSSLHVHLDHDNCLEVIVLKGKAKDVHHLADALIGTRGVKHGELVITTTGKNIL